MNKYPKSKDLHQGSNYKPPSPHHQKPKRAAQLQDTTLHGEMVPTSFMWLAPDKQRDRAHELEDITDPESE